MRQRWICDKCQTQWKTKKEAEQCEQAHPGPDKFEIEHVSYYDGPFYRHDNIYINAPSKVRIRFGNEIQDFATYTLSHIGPRGC